jgi:hypothetical protein
MSVILNLGKNRDGNGKREGLRLIGRYGSHSKPRFRKYNRPSRKALEVMIVDSFGPFWNLAVGTLPF